MIDCPVNHFSVVLRYLSDAVYVNAFRDILVVLYDFVRGAVFLAYALHCVPDSFQTVCKLCQFFDCLMVDCLGCVDDLNSQ